MRQSPGRVKMLPHTGLTETRLHGNRPVGSKRAPKTLTGGVYYAIQLCGIKDVCH
jgi:hypothetical protein